MNDAFERWWHEEGGIPRVGSWEDHCKAMCEIAWENGVYTAINQPDGVRKEAVAKAYDEGYLDGVKVMASPLVNQH